MRPHLVGALLPLLLVQPPRQAATIVVTGRVTNAADGSPLQGANVYETMTPASVGTDASGRYRILLSRARLRDSVVVRVRAIGFVPASRAIGIAADSVTVNFALQVDINRLNEVVVTGVTGATQSRNLAFTVSKVPAGAALVERAAGPSSLPLRGRRDHEFNTESYDRIVDNPFLSALDNPLSTFSIDVDHASYSNTRRFVTQGRLPPKDAVRIEEFVNYFPYDYAEPGDGRPFSVTTDVAPAPWQSKHLLVRVGLQSRHIERAALPPSNLVFLIDVSGSMQPPQKLPLLKQAFGLLVEQLRPRDRVAIVVYAGAAGLVLPSTPGDRTDEILAALQRLHAGGSTAGGAGIRLAYQVARANFIPHGNNRVILATDGDFNIGASSDAEMERLIEEKRKDGTFLSVLGFGMGNYKDSKMEKLADKGNGNYAYIDDLMEARKVFVDELAGTLLTVAKDVKLQVEFNPARVASYRLIGYENRVLRKEDFNDDRKDAGDMGAGNSVTALYEIVQVGDDDRDAGGESIPLRYQQPARARTTDARRGNELLYVSLRYKLPDESRSRLFGHAVLAGDLRRHLGTDFRFAAAVASFGMILRDSPYRGSTTIDDVIAQARGALGRDPGGYRLDFVKMAERVRELSLVAARDPR